MSGVFCTAYFLIGEKVKWNGLRFAQVMVFE